MRTALNRPNSNARKELTGDRSAAGAPRPDRAPGTARAVLLLLLALALAPPAAAQGDLGGVMRFATAEVAFHGGFGGVAFDVWRVEPYGYLSQDAGVWAIQAGVAAPVVRRESPWVSLRLGTGRSPGRRSSRTSTRPWALGCASDGASARWPKWTARRRSRCCAPVCSSAGEGSGHASQAPLASRHSGRHPATRGARPGLADAPGHGTAVRGFAGACGAADADVRGGVRRLLARPPRTDLLRQLRKYRTRAAFRGEEQRRARLVAELRTARLTGIRVAVPVEALEARLAGLPEGVVVEPGRIEVRFTGAREAVVRLFALAQALTNDYERFETLVERSG